MDHDASTEDLIAGGESQAVEFKSTARYNLETGEHDSRLEHAVLKTVCGLMNAEGGSVLIGVSDDGTVRGLDDDFSTLTSKPNADGFELFLRQMLDSGLSVNTAATVRIRFPVVHGTVIGLVSVAASGKPVFASPAKGRGDGSEFWVRIGNATRHLHGEEMVAYQGDHWG